MSSSAAAGGLYLGVDIGTSSSKGVIVDDHGQVLTSALRQHAVDQPGPGQFEMPAELWWDEFASISRELVASAGRSIAAVGVSGMGPCVCVADEHGVPLRPAILYGIDTRAAGQIHDLNAELGNEAIVERCGSALSAQSVGPKLRWLADHEPELAARARKLFMPASWLAFRLTGAYVLDHQSASQSTPMYDTAVLRWYEPWVRVVAPELELPELVWADTVIGEVTAAAATVTGIPAGVPVIAGTIDAWSEAISVGATRSGDTMLMYGTTMFMVQMLSHRITSDTLWGTVGATEGTFSLAAGMATSGAITSWLRELTGGPDYEALLKEAQASGVGAHGLLMLPYFSGERTPIADPLARGVIAGLTLSHTRGDLYRAALEATAYGVRHNLMAMRRIGGALGRIVAVGGGTSGGLWTRIVSDVAGIEQQIPSVMIGASFGAAYLAACATGSAEIDVWNPISHTVSPNPEASTTYDRGFDRYLELYERTAPLVHALAEAG